MRFIYSLILYLLLPVALCRLWWRNESGRNIRQRFGFCPKIVPAGCIWLHAVSVGEVVAASPLIETLLGTTEQAILVTTTTSTGKNILQQHFGGQVSHCYIPYDIPGSVRRFLNATQPSKVLFMEAEIWPNIYHQLSTRNVPLFLVNARCSQNSFNGYRRVRSLVKQTLSCVKHIAAQTQQDADRYSLLGAKQEAVSVTGNLKFDATLSDHFSQNVQQLRARLGVDRKIWVAASTHSGEEAIVLASHRGILQQIEDALLILVPRHPERADKLMRLCDGAGFQFELSSNLNDALSIHHQVLIVNELGKLTSYYGVADVAFIGGSLVDRGGHNPIEAVLAETPIICGESVQNFDEIYAQLKQVEAVVQVQDERQLEKAVLQLMNDKLRAGASIEASQLMVQRNRGAVNRIMRLLV